jgi:hypothetical protein
MGAGESRAAPGPVEASLSERIYLLRRDEQAGMITDQEVAANIKCLLHEWENSPGGVLEGKDAVGPDHTPLPSAQHGMDSGGDTLPTPYALFEGNDAVGPDHTPLPSARPGKGFGGVSLPFFLGTPTDKPGDSDLLRVPTLILQPTSPQPSMSVQGFGPGGGEDVTCSHMLGGATAGNSAGAPASQSGQLLSSNQHEHASHVPSTSRPVTPIGVGSGVTSLPTLIDQPTSPQPSMSAQGFGPGGGEDVTCSHTLGGATAGNSAGAPASQSGQLLSSNQHEHASHVPSTSRPVTPIGVGSGVTSLPTLIDQPTSPQPSMSVQGLGPGGGEDVTCSHTLGGATAGNLAGAPASQSGQLLSFNQREHASHVPSTPRLGTLALGSADGSFQDRVINERMVNFFGGGAGGDLDSCWIGSEEEGTGDWTDRQVEQYEAVFGALGVSSTSSDLKVSAQDQPPSEPEVDWMTEPCWVVPGGRDRLYSGKFVPASPDDDPRECDGVYSWEAQQDLRLNRLLSGDSVPLSPTSAMYKAERNHDKALLLFEEYRVAYRKEYTKSYLLEEVGYRRRCSSFRVGGCASCDARLVKVADTVARLEFEARLRWDREVLISRRYKGDLDLADQGLISRATITPPTVNDAGVLYYVSPLAGTCDYSPLAPRTTSSPTPSLDGSKSGRGRGGGGRRGPKFCQGQGGGGVRDGFVGFGLSSSPASSLHGSSSGRGRGRGGRGCQGQGPVEGMPELDRMDIG